LLLCDLSNGAIAFAFGSTDPLALQLGNLLAKGSNLFWSITDLKYEKEYMDKINAHLLVLLPFRLGVGR